MCSTRGLQIAGNETAERSATSEKRAYLDESLTSSSVTIMEDKAATADDAPYLSREKILDVSEIPPLPVYAHLEHAQLDTIDAGIEDTDGPAPPLIEAGYVYILMEMKDGYATGYYQVGSTTDTTKRLSELQVGNVRPLRYTVGHCSPVRDMRRAETAAVCALDRYSIDLGGGAEWFYVNSAKADAFYSTFVQEVDRFQ